jgi:hypothetical protein
MDELNTQPESLEYLKFIVGVLLPGDKNKGLPGADEIIVEYNIIDTEIQSSFDLFMAGFKESLEGDYKISSMNPEKVLDFVRAPTPKSNPFLIKLLEIYYTNSQVLSSLQGAAGVLFPNVRKMPLVNLEILEPVVENALRKKNQNG